MKLNQVHITTPEHISVSFRVAGLGSRAASHMIDSFIIMILYSSLLFSFVLLSDYMPQITSEGYILAILILILSFLWFFYFILFEFFAAGRTPGKMLIGLRVVQDNGQSITFLSAVLRNILRLIDLLPAIYVIGILMIFFHTRHKRIGDLAAGTMVIYENRRRRRKSGIEKELEQRGIGVGRIHLDERASQKIGVREWKLLKTYVDRWPSLNDRDRDRMTVQVADILLPLVGLDAKGKPYAELENDLFALYLQLREDWEFGHAKSDGKSKDE
ncbi:MAG: RDD family protein [Bacillaceae bacterium]|nr:RDD family protein [Bacillaceae bacterium]